MVIGLQAVGTSVYRNGRPWRHVGVNNFALFMRELYSFSGVPNPGLVSDVNAMADRGIKLVRVGFGWFDYTRWRDLYHLDKPTYWAAVTRTLDALASRGVLCIANMGWSVQAFTQLTYYTTGATIAPSRLPDKTSALHSLWVEYITDFVSRYKNHPAIGAWQFGNEMSGKLGNEWRAEWAVDGSFNAAVDMGLKPEGTAYAASDKMSHANYVAFTRQFVDLVHSLDPHGRMVLSGDAIGNSFAVGVRRQNSLAADSYSDWDGRPDTGGVNWLAYREQAFDGVCSHIYPLAAQVGDGQFFSDADRTYREHIQYAKAWADEAGKPLILEEWGATRYGSNVDPTSTDLASETENFTEALQAIQDYDVPISCLWNWGGNVSGGIEWQLWDVTHSSRTYQLDAIQRVNESRY